MVKESIVIEPGQNGLGDNLLFSVLPERFVRERNVDVYIRQMNWRNPGIPELIWLTNPFIKGIINEQGNIKGVGWDDITRLSIEHGSTIKALEAYHGFEPKNNYPKLYNVPYIHKGVLNDKILIDPTAFTIKYSKEFIEEFINHLIYFNLIALDKCLVVDAGPTYYGKSLLTDDILPNIERIKIENIFDYANSIRSCSIFIGAASGSIALASALKEDGPYPKKIYSFITNAQLNQHIWTWPNVIYFPGDNLYKDFQTF